MIDTRHAVLLKVDHKHGDRRWCDSRDACGLPQRGRLGAAIAQCPSPSSGGGHYCNIVRFAGDVLLLDGQLGRQVSWPEYRRMGFTEFQLLQTN